MQIRVNRYIAATVVVMAYPVLYYSWIVQIKNSWVCCHIVRYKMIFYAVISIFCTRNRGGMRLNKHQSMSRTSSNRP